MPTPMYRRERISSFTALAIDSLVMQQLSSTSPLPHSQRGNGREGGGEVGLRKRGGKKERERGGLGSGNDLHIP